MDIQKSLSSFQFIGSHVQEFSFENSFINYSERDQMKEKTYDLDFSNPDISMKDDYKLGTILLFLKTDVANDQCQFHLSLTLEGAFIISKDTPDEDFARFLSLNGATTLYSIARSFVMSTSSQCFSSGSIVLPMVNILDYSKRKEHSDP